MATKRAGIVSYSLENGWNLHWADSFVSSDPVRSAAATNESHAQRPRSIGLPHRALCQAMQRPLHPAALRHGTAALPGRAPPFAMPEQQLCEPCRSSSCTSSSPVQQQSRPSCALREWQRRPSSALRAARRSPLVRKRKEWVGWIKERGRSCMDKTDRTHVRYISWRIG
jgi:hypothetical protein